MVFNYCPICGEKLTNREIGDEGSIPFCEKCGRPWFTFSYPCVLCLVIDNDENIALIKQSYVSDHYVCVAGYVKEKETIEQAARREVEEETGLCVHSVKYIKSYYYPKRDNLMHGFICRVKTSDFTLSCEVDRAQWFPLEEGMKLLREGSVARTLLNDYMLMMQ